MVRREGGNHTCPETLGCMVDVNSNDVIYVYICRTDLIYSVSEVTTLV